MRQEEERISQLRLLKGELLLSKNLIEDAIFNFEQSLSINSSWSNHVGIAFHYEKIHKMSKAKELLERAIPLASNNEELAITQNNLSVILNHLNEYELGKKLLEESLDNYEKLENSKNVKQKICVTLNNLGNVEKVMLNFDSAIVHFLKAEELINELLKQESNYEWNIFLATLHNNMAVCYKSIMNHEMASEFFIKSFDKYNNIQNEFNINTVLDRIMVSNNLGNLFVDTDYQKSNEPPRPRGYGVSLPQG